MENNIKYLVVEITESGTFGDNNFIGVYDLKPDAELVRNKYISDNTTDLITFLSDNGYQPNDPDGILDWKYTTHSIKSSVVIVEITNQY